MQPACAADMAGEVRLVLQLRVDAYHGSTALQGLLMSSRQVASLCTGKEYQCEAIMRRCEKTTLTRELQVYADYWDLNRSILLLKFPSPLFTIRASFRDLSTQLVKRQMAVVQSRALVSQLKFLRFTHAMNSHIVNVLLLKSYLS